MGSIKDSLGSWSFLFGPTVAFLMVAVLTLLLRWAFARGRSVVTPRKEEYLVEAGRYLNAVEAEYFRCVLSGAGLTSTVETIDRHQVLMVPETELRDAKRLMADHSLN